MKFVFLFLFLMFLSFFVSAEPTNELFRQNIFEYWKEVFKSWLFDNESVSSLGGGIDLNGQQFNLVNDHYEIVDYDVFSSGDNSSWNETYSNTLYCSSSNIAFAEVQGHLIGETQLSEDVYSNITNLSLGSYKLFTFNTSGNHELIVGLSGTYSVTAHLSFDGSANSEYHLSLGVNGIRDSHCHARRKIGTGNDVGSVSFTCLDFFDLNDALTIMVENVDNDGEINVRDINLNLVRIYD